VTIPRDLTRDECVALLAAGTVGRIALCTADGPHIEPVNYVVDGESIVFRTSAYSLLGQHDWGSSTVAFEVDELDPVARSGRSVVVRGAAERIEDSDEVDGIARTTDPSPWAGGLRRQYVRIPYAELTGRAVGDEPTDPSH
jgi:nitroimidazol reductase NimA-like FMN-containing flavoprotein (pyridoxamine 5'-phosphate oxidase superfamily)